MSRLLERRLDIMGFQHDISSFRVLFQLCILKRQHSKKGNFVSSNAGLLERDFGNSLFRLRASAEMGKQN